MLVFWGWFIAFLIFAYVWHRAVSTVIEKKVFFDVKRGRLRETNQKIDVVAVLPRNTPVPDTPYDEEEERRRFIAEREAFELFGVKLEVQNARNLAEIKTILENRVKLAAKTNRSAQEQRTLEEDFFGSTRNSQITGQM